MYHANNLSSRVEKCPNAKACLSLDNVLPKKTGLSAGDETPVTSSDTPVIKSGVPRTKLEVSWRVFVNEPVLDVGYITKLLPLDNLK